MINTIIVFFSNLYTSFIKFINTFNNNSTVLLNKYGGFEEDNMDDRIDI
jgi:hypothetical protein